MKILRVNRDTFDVFMSDEYWGDWTRVRVGGPNGVYGVAGRRVPNATLKQVAAQINGR